MRAVTKDEFFAAIGTLDVHPQIQPGPHPYTSLWKMRYGGGIVGKSVGRFEQGRSWNDYFVSEQ